MTIDRSFHLLPESASSYAHQLDWLMLFLTASSVLITLTVLGMVVYFGLRYRRRTEDEVPPAAAASHGLEIGTAIVMFGMFMVMFFWGVGLYIDSRRPPVDALRIDVVGKQWMWKTQHPGGQSEINALHVPVGRPVKLVMTSLDVIHSFGVPAFRIKQDVLPGAYTTQWFMPTKVGVYHLFCQEYCGADHSLMGGKVVVMEPKDYDAWLAGVPADYSAAAAGSVLFTSLGCAQCHGQEGPTLAGVYKREVLLSDGSRVIADEAYLRESILNPSSQIVAGYGRLMPSYQGQLDETQLNQLVAYMKTLGSSMAVDAARARDDSSAAPAGPSINAVAPRDTPNMPPARQPPLPRRVPPSPSDHGASTR